MTGSSAHEIMNAAMMLEEGDKIITRCNSYDEMETLRKNLYRVRNIIMKTNKTLAWALQIERETKEDNWLVIVTKELTASNVVIIKKDGSVQPLERIAPAVMDSVDETERMVKLMKEDGKSEEEIAEALALVGEEAFDKAATKIEEAQELAPEPEDEAA